MPVTERRLVLSKLNACIRQLQERNAILSQQTDDLRNDNATLRDHAARALSGDACLQQQVDRLYKAVAMGDKRCGDLLKQLDGRNKEVVHMKKELTRMSDVNYKQEQSIQTAAKLQRDMEQRLAFANALLAAREPAANAGA